ncbi:hypothetical protein BDR22DRAFT_621062 [Usnea florida]
MCIFKILSFSSYRDIRADLLQPRFCECAFSKRNTPITLCRSSLQKLEGESLGLALLRIRRVQGTSASIVDRSCANLLPFSLNFSTPLARLMRRGMRRMRRPGGGSGRRTARRVKRPDSQKTLLTLSTLSARQGKRFIQTMNQFQASCPIHS